MSQFSARPTSNPEVFELSGMIHHPAMGFWIFRNGDIHINVGSQIDSDLGTFDVRKLPTGGWIALQDREGQPLPVEVYVQPFGRVFARFVGFDGKPVAMDPTL